jgi:glutamate racemase
MNAPIGVFDSGMGGLTVLAALRAALPSADFVYLGDTARLPYGTKSATTVVRYAVQAGELLAERGVGALVVACNTASSVALPALQQRFESLPIIGVVEPGAAAAVAATRSGHVAVIATEGTVRGGAYERAIQQLRANTRVSSLACPLFVALAEEGWTEGDVANAAAQRYLRPWLGGLQPRPDVLVLGCTHFPVMAATIRAVIGAELTLVDSAATTAAAVRARLAAGAAAGGGSCSFLATDGAERFARVGSRFLGAPIAPGDVELVDL